MCGHVIIYPQKPDALLNVLPPSIEDDALQFVLSLLDLDIQHKPGYDSMLHP